VTIAVILPNKQIWNPPPNHHGAGCCVGLALLSFARAVLARAPRRRLALARGPGLMRRQRLQSSANKHRHDGRNLHDECLWEGTRGHAAMNANLIFQEGASNAEFSLRLSAFSYSKLKKISVSRFVIETFQA